MAALQYVDLSSNYSTQQECKPERTTVASGMPLFMFLTMNMGPISFHYTVQRPRKPGVHNLRDLGGKGRVHSVQNANLSQGTFTHMPSTYNIFFCTRKENQKTRRKPLRP